MSHLDKIMSSLGHIFTWLVKILSTLAKIKTKQTVFE
jgi:hypothetical protein